MAFDWDHANINHIARHGITSEEAEQVVLNDPMDLPMQLRDGEERTPPGGRNRCRTPPSCRHGLARGIDSGGNSISGEGPPPETV